MADAILYVKVSLFLAHLKYLPNRYIASPIAAPATGVTMESLILATSVNSTKSSCIEDVAKLHKKIQCVRGYYFLQLSSNRIQI